MGRANIRARVLSELTQESRVVLEEQSNVRDPILPHRDSFDAESECESCPFLRINAHCSEDIWINHATTDKTIEKQTLKQLLMDDLRAMSSIADLERFCKSMDEFKAKLLPRELEEVRYFYQARLKDLS